MLRRSSPLLLLALLAGCEGLHSKPILECDAGLHVCTDTCVADDSVEQCGAACLKCVPPKDATGFCARGTCDFVCSPTQFRCGSSCCRAVAVTTGLQHSCALTDHATVSCWGSGSGIGDGTFNPEHLTAIEIPVGGDAGVAQLSASLFNTCARLTSGALRCWGNNGNGSVGDGTTTFRPAPVEVFAEGVTDVSFGAFFGCAVVGQGVQCWGIGTSGQLGDGAGASRSAPGSVSGLLFGVNSVWTGYNTACVGTDAGFFCWGSNGAGEVGDLTNTSPHKLPVPVLAVDAGILELHPALLANCALTTSRGVKCFGSNSNGQIGDGTTNSPAFRAVDAIGLGGGVSQLASGSSGEHFCAIRDGGAYCWGLNDKGQLGDTTVVNKRVPTPVFGLGAVRWISTGDKHTCAVTLEGTVKCWGLNDKGQLGDGTKVDHWVPTDVR